jgi:hypothetical protein
MLFATVAHEMHRHILVWQSLQLERDAHAPRLVGTGHTVEQALGTMNVDPEGFHREWKGRVERR